MKKSDSATPSSNWFALKKTFSRPTTKSRKLPKKDLPPTYAAKKRKRSESVSTVGSAVGGRADGGECPSFPREDVDTEPIAGPSTVTATTTRENEAQHGGRDSMESLRRMILGQTTFSESQLQPGKYLALDCEMVGVGIDGSESSLARVSLVNYHGVVILDEFVRQRERVVDYRTFVSGVRASDMLKAKPFEEMQNRIAALLKDRILVGHAVFNDLKALLLSHSRPLIRDTQLCAGKAKLLKTKYPSLRKLVQQEFGIDIQSGEHSSVIDARATMALYRLHRKEWDKDWHPPQLQAITKAAEVKNLKRKRGSDDTESQATADAVKKGKQKDIQGARGEEGRKGISSGLSTVVKRASGKGVERIVKGHSRSQVTVTSKGSKTGTKSNDKWWATLGGGTSGSKGSVSISRSK